MELTTEDFNEIMYRYGTLEFRIDAQPSYGEITYGLGTHVHRNIIKDNSVTVELKFYSNENFIKFFQVHHAQILEEKLREKSPTLQRAWEEYQLLLKLSKC